MLRGGKSLPLYTRVTAAKAPLAIVLPASSSAGLQVPLRSGDVTWQDFLTWAPLGGAFDPHVADAQEVTNILFSSGTTVTKAGLGLACVQLQ